MNAEVNEQGAVIESVLCAETKIATRQERYRAATDFWYGLLEESPVADRQDLESRDGYAKLHVQIVQVITCQQYISGSFRRMIVVCR